MKNFVFVFISIIIIKIIGLPLFVFFAFIIFIYCSAYNYIRLLINHNKKLKIYKQVYNKNCSENNTASKYNEITIKGVNQPSQRNELPKYDSIQYKIFIDNNGYYRFKNSGALLHRWLAEKKLGRKLHYKEIVHHIDGNKLNNKMDNLHICTQKEHNQIHINNLILTGSWFGR